jgi:hypothetical protein
MGKIQETLDEKQATLGKKKGRNTGLSFPAMPVYRTRRVRKRQLRLPD